MVTHLNEVFLEKFEAVPQWQDGSYEKPKFHPALHLEVALEEFGPFRAFWCMSFEGHLQPFKQMFRMCNWKSAPHAVGMHWATKSVMHYRDPGRGSWYTNQVVPTADFTDGITALSQQSPLIGALVRSGEAPQSARPVRKVVRGPDEVRLKDWLIVREANEPPRACRVESMMECVPQSAGFSVVRMWCQSTQVNDDSGTGSTWAPLNTIARWVVLKFEAVHVQLVSRVETPNCIQFY